MNGNCKRYLNLFDQIVPGYNLASIKFVDRLGLDYVPCYPYHESIARLIAILSTIEYK